MRAIIDEPMLAHAKRYLREQLPEIQSCHRTEALARAWGFRTQASALSELNVGWKIAELDGQRGVEFLRERGFAVEGVVFSRAWAHAAMNAIAELDDHLTTAGYGVSSYHHRTVPEWRDAFAKARRELSSGYFADAFLASVRYLRLMKRRGTVNRDFTSYNLKHDVERFMDARGEPTYVPNGVFIAAAVHAGFSPQRIAWDSQNAWLRVSSRTIKEVRVAVKFAKLENGDAIY